jgi:hypothetical protein
MTAAVLSMRSMRSMRGGFFTTKVSSMRSVRSMRGAVTHGDVSCRLFFDKRR